MNFLKSNLAGRLLKINLILLVILAATLPYLNSLSTPEFISDDSALFKTGSLIRDMNNWDEIITQGWWQDNYASYFFLYRPLTTLTFAVNFAVGRLNPFSYHLVNLILHIINSLLVFVLIKSLFKKNVPALVTGLLFAVHPIHTEAVNWLVGRTELLSFSFVLASLIFYLNYRRRFKTIHLVLALTFFILALLAKENGIVVLPLVILVELFLLPRQPAKVLFKNSLTNLRKLILPYAFFLSIAGTWLVWRWAVERFFDPLVNSVESGVAFIGNNPLYFLAFWERFINGVKILVFYALKLLAWPVKLAHLYYFDSISVSRGFDPEIIISFLVVAALLFLTVYWFKNHRGLFFASGWFLASFLPFSNLFFPIPLIFGERLLYLPSLGFCLFLAIFFDKLHRRKQYWLKALAVVLLTVVLLAGAWRTYQRNFDWQSGRLLDQKTFEAVPNNIRVRFNIALNLIADGRLQEAASHLEEILKIEPNHQQAEQVLRDIKYEIGLLPDKTGEDINEE